MILQALIFYLFAGICVASAVMVIVSRNPVHSVLFLILAFFNAAGLFVLLGAEFLAMTGTEPAGSIRPCHGNANNDHRRRPADGTGCR